MMEKSAVETMQKSCCYQVLVMYESTRCLLFDQPPCGEEIKKQLSVIEDIPALLFTLSFNGRTVQDTEILDMATAFVKATLAGGLLGGKGGFGAQLRALAKQSGKKKTTDFGACRDLSGRRLRHVNDEILLQKWKEAKDQGEEFDTEERTLSGINMWHLTAPSWSDRIKPESKHSAYIRSRRKTRLCSDWLEARATRDAPPGAPANWGCPRGHKCPFAHGEAELEGDGKEALEQEQAEEYARITTQKRDAYMMGAKGVSGERDEDNNGVADMVEAGMRAQKKARLMEQQQEATTKSSATVASTVVSSSSSASSSSLRVEQQVSEQGPADEPLLPLDGGPISTNAAVHFFSSIAAEVAAASSHPPPAKRSYLHHTSSSGSGGFGGVGGVRGGCPWLRSVAGAVETTSEGEVEGHSEFATVAVAGCALRTGQWYYEVELLSAGIIQIGWASHLFRRGDDVEEDDGVGDDQHSWAFDGFRGKKWNKEDADYGSHTSAAVKNTTTKSGTKKTTGGGSVKGKNPTNDHDALDNDDDDGHFPWQAGDVIGCLLSFSEAASTGTRASMSYTVNGMSLGVAYSGLDTAAVMAIVQADYEKGNSGAGLYPALSLENGEAVVVNIGHRPFRFPPSSSSSSLAKESPKKGKKTNQADSVVEDKDQGKEREEDGSPYLPIVAALVDAARSSTGLPPLPPAVNTLPKTSLATTTSTKKVTTIASSSSSSAPVEYPAIDLSSETYSDQESLEALGLVHLKQELERRGLKAGGTLTERAQRLFSVRGLAPAKYPAHVRVQKPKITTTPAITATTTTKTKTAMSAVTGGSGKK